MAKYIVRTWVDLIVEADSVEEAKRLSESTKIKVNESLLVKEYDMQTANVWIKE